MFGVPIQGTSTRNCSPAGIAVEPGQQAERRDEDRERTDQRPHAAALRRRRARNQQRDQERRPAAGRELGSGGSSGKTSDEAHGHDHRHASRTAPRSRNCGCCRIAAGAARCPHRGSARPTPLTMPSISPASTPFQSTMREPPTSGSNHRGVVDFIHEILVVDQIDRAP